MEGKAATVGQVRGSYRIQSDAIKRGQPDYSGLDGSVKKRKTTRKKPKASPKPASPVVQASVANGHGFSSEGRPVDREVGAHHEPANTKELASESSSAVAGTLCAGLPNSSAPPQKHLEQTHTTSAEESRPGEVHNSSADQLVRSASPAPAIVAPGTAKLIEPIRNSLPQASLSPMLPPPVSTPGFSEDGMKVIESILLDCARLNFEIFRFGPAKGDTATTTDLENIRTFTKDLAELDYGPAVRIVKKENAIIAGKNIQSRYNETVYWDIILKAAEGLDPNNLPTPKGPPDGFTREEKEATRMFMAEAGHSMGVKNQRRLRRRWKSLNEMRKAGVDKILFYRTNEFNIFCDCYPVNRDLTLLETVQLWERVYGPQIDLLELRIKNECERCLTGRFWLDQQYVATRLDIPKDFWNSAKNAWRSSAERARYEMDRGTSGMRELRELFDTHVEEDEEGEVRNMSMMVSVFPRDGEGFLICPIVTVKKGDFLGTFAGEIRYSEEFNKSYGIPGPEQSLWLDYSRTTGALNFMRVSEDDSDANVSLEWEPCKEQDGENVHLAWRVSVRALRVIKPSEELIRVTRRRPQVLLHIAPNARRGYMKSVKT